MTSSMNRLTKIIPIQLLVIGYALVVLLGALLLMLPISSSDGRSQPFVDALFISSSAVSTTGLVVVDVGSFYTLFGELVTLIVFQIGGIGYMVFIVLIAYAVGGKPSLISSVVFKESLSGVTLANTKRFMKEILLLTLLFEGVGAILLAIFWYPQYGFLKSLYLGVYHSVSGFCTCGFSLLPDNLMSGQDSLIVNFTCPVICIAGGIGFFVLADIRDFVRKKISKMKTCRLSVHTKLALVVSFFLMAGGTAIIFLSEGGFPLKERVLISVFQSTSASTTTGFNTVDIGAMSDTSVFTMALLMFIGAAPGGTGGGIKVTSLGVMLLVAWAVLKGREDVNVFNRRISPDTVRRSFFIGLSMAVWTIAATMILTVTENEEFLKILFEVCSAIGNTGLSTGITFNLSMVGKYVLSLTMFYGRVGPLALALSLVGKPKPETFRYAEGEVFAG